jgi:hypothetical protein
MKKPQMKSPLPWREGMKGRGEMNNFLSPSPSPVRDFVAKEKMVKMSY